MSLSRGFYTNNSYTIEGLCEQMKNFNFSAGVPSLVSDYWGTWIVFPGLDEFNQVRIRPYEFMFHPGKIHNKWEICKWEHKTGLGNEVVHKMLDDFTFGATTGLSLFTKNAKKGFELVDKTVAEIQTYRI